MATCVTYTKTVAGSSLSNPVVKIDVRSTGGARPIDPAHSRNGSLNDAFIARPKAKLIFVAVFAPITARNLFVELIDGNQSDVLRLIYQDVFIICGN